MRVEKHEDGSHTIHVPAGWQIVEYVQSGQPNGIGEIGEIEPSWFRDWYRTDRETHDRTEIELLGPWIERS